MSRNLTSTELKRLHRDWRRRTAGRVALIVDGAQGPFNVGAIVRTAAAERVDHIWFAAGATTPANTRVGRTAMGTERYVTWSEHETVADTIDLARTAGYRVVGVELAEGAAPLHEVDLRGDVCLVIGHEDRGLSKDTLASCDRLAYIPQLGKVGSLNVATAASIAMYEVRRQAWSANESATS
jgi:tRNA (guanosine-2'-O-)-methyltransferase